MNLQIFGSRPRFLWLCAALSSITPFVVSGASISGTVHYSGNQSGLVRIHAAQTIAGNRGLLLDGDGDSVETLLQDLSGSEITIQYWFNGLSIQSAVRQQGGAGWVVAGWNGTHILQHDGGTSGISAGSSITDGGWHHVAMTWKQASAGGFASYLDGQPVTSRQSSETPIPNYEVPVYLGAYQGTAEFSNGTLDEIAIFKRALTAAEIQAGWRARLAGNEADLLAFWNFDDGSADDKSGGGHHGTLAGDAQIVGADIPGFAAGFETVELAAAGPYSIGGLPPGPGYRLTAFLDANGNGRQDVGEPFGSFSENPFELSGDRPGTDVVLNEIPSITAHPIGLRVGTGVEIALTVAAGGSTPLTYEWRRDDLPLSDGGRISGASSPQLRISNIETADAGSYTVRIQNVAGRVDSNPAAVLIVAGGATVSGVLSYSGSQSGPIRVSASQRFAGNRALELNGTSAYAATTLTDLSGSEFTVQYWFKGTSFQSAVRQQSGGWIVAGWNGLHILSNDRGTEGISAGNNITDGNWHQLVVTWKQNTPAGFASYLDGQPVTQRDSSNTPIPNHDSQVYFGAFQGTAEFARGQLDEIVIWRRALSASEIAANWRRAGTQPLSADLAGYWNFDEALGLEVAQDLSGNGNHAELFEGAMVAAADNPNLGAAFEDAFQTLGSYTLGALPPGPGYFITAYMDVNANAQPDAGEPTGSYSNNPIALAGSQTNVDIVLADPPVIVEQPAALRLSPGSTARFRVVATGLEPLQYQWFQGSTALVDGGKTSGAATSELTLTGISVAEEGSYSVRVSNAVGEASTVPAGLSVSSGITDRLVGHWKLDELSGDVATDSSSSGNAGALNNYDGSTPSWSAGQVGGALSFGGPETAQFVLVPSYTKPTSTASASAWAFAESRPTWASIIKNWGGSQVGQFHFGLHSDGGDLSNFITTGSGANPFAREGIEFPLGSWQHTAFVADGTSVIVYRNGAEVGKVPYDGTFVSSPMASLGIGVKLDDAGEAADSGAPGYWHGRLDDIGLWTRALSPEEVLGVYQAGLAGKNLALSTPASATITLVVSRVSGGIEISWPPESVGFLLEAGPSLAPGSWTPVAGVVNNRIVVDPAAAATAYYRLGMQ